MKQLTSIWRRRLPAFGHIGTLGWAALLVLGMLAGGPLYAQQAGSDSLCLHGWNPDSTGGSGPDNLRFVQITPDAVGNGLALGYREADSTYLFLQADVAPQGNLLLDYDTLATLGPESGINTYRRIAEMQMDVDGKLWLTGSWTSNKPNNNPSYRGGFFITRLDTNGDTLVHIQAGDTTARAQAYDLAVDDSCHAWVAAYVEDTVVVSTGDTLIGPQQVFTGNSALLKVDTSGVLDFHAVHTANNTVYGKNVLLANNEVWLQCESLFSIDSVDFGGGYIQVPQTQGYFLVRFDRMGRHLGSNGYGFNSAIYQRGAPQLAADDQGRVYFASIGRGPMANATDTLLPATTVNSLFITRLDSSGAVDTSFVYENNPLFSRGSLAGLEVLRNGRIALGLTVEGRLTSAPPTDPDTLKFGPQHTVLLPEAPYQRHAVATLINSLGALTYGVRVGGLDTTTLNSQQDPLADMALAEPLGERLLMAGAWANDTNFYQPNPQNDTLWNALALDFCKNCPSGTLSVTNDTLCGTNVATLQASGYANYLWFNQPTGGQPLDSNQVYQPAVYLPDTFWVAGYDSCGLSTRLPAYVERPQGPAPSGIGDTACGGQDAVLRGDPPKGTYLWFENEFDISPVAFGDSIQVPNVQRQDTLWLRDRDSCGWTEAEPVIVVLEVGPAPPTTNDTLCGTTNPTLQVSGAFPSYRWYASSNPNDTTVLDTSTTFRPTGVVETDTFYVSGLDTCGLSLRAPAIAYVQRGPAPQQVSNDTACLGEPAQFVVADTGRVHYWFNQSFGGDTTVLQTGDTFNLPNTSGTDTFWVASRDSCGYTQRAPALLVLLQPAPPQVTSDVRQTVCQGDSARFTVTGGAQQFWSNGATGQQVWLKQPGFYTVYLQDADSCRSASVTVQLSLIDTLIPPPTYQQDSVCPGDTLTLYAGGVGQRSWFDTNLVAATPIAQGDTLEVFNVQLGDTLWLVDSAQCGVSPRIPVRLAVDSLPLPPFTPRLEVCPADTALMQLPLGPNYRWYTTDDPAVTNFINSTNTLAVPPPHADSTLWVSQVGRCGEGGRAAFSIRHRPQPPAPLLDPAGEAYLPPGDSLSLQASRPLQNTGAPAYWGWTANAGADTLLGVADSTLLVQGPGLYRARYRLGFSAADCWSAWSDTLRVVDDSTLLSLQEGWSRWTAPACGLAPNPTLPQQTLLLHLPGSSPKQFLTTQLLDSRGRVIHTWEEQAQTGGSLEVDLSEAPQLPEGLYLLRAFSAKGAACQAKLLVR